MPSVAEIDPEDSRRPRSESTTPQPREIPSARIMGAFLPPPPGPPISGFPPQNHESESRLDITHRLNSLSLGPESNGLQSEHRGINGRERLSRLLMGMFDAPETNAWSHPFDIPYLNQLRDTEFLARPIESQASNPGRNPERAREQRDANPGIERTSAFEPPLVQPNTRPEVDRNMPPSPIFLSPMNPPHILGTVEAGWPRQEGPTPNFFSEDLIFSGSFDQSMEGMDLLKDSYTITFSDIKIHLPI
ncbi:hypothetical protein DENSPDRAFT_849930 [Dentipellis sp. KUC8613]|nr:hypothetical protein DENSPDRAFT_849930 [Dentipellis sp. KUC8613]